MMKPASFRELIETTFGGRDRFAAETGIEISHVDVMKHRNSIAPEHWPAIARAAERLSYSVDLSDLADIRLRRKRELKVGGNTQDVSSLAEGAHA